MWVSASERERENDAWVRASVSQLSLGSDQMFVVLLRNNLDLAQWHLMHSANALLHRESLK